MQPREKVCPLGRRRRRRLDSLEPTQRPSQAQRERQLNTGFVSAPAQLCNGIACSLAATALHLIPLPGDSAHTPAAASHVSSWHPWETSGEWDPSVSVLSTKANLWEFKNPCTRRLFLQHRGTVGNPEEMGLAARVCGPLLGSFGTDKRSHIRVRPGGDVEILHVFSILELWGSNLAAHSRPNRLPLPIRYCTFLLDWAIFAKL